MSVSLEAVTFAYPGAEPVLRNASMHVESGSFALVRGPSGSGKSTLLRLLCRLEEPREGVVRFRGTDIRAIPPTELRRKVAYVQQTPTLVDGSVRDNLLLPFAFRANARLERPGDEELATRLRRFRIEAGQLDQDARTLSVGEAQRVCLIRTLLLAPDLLLMDEPTSALDATSAAVVLETARRQHQEGKTLILVSHADEAPDGITTTIEVEGGSLRVGKESRQEERA